MTVIRPPGEFYERIDALTPPELQLGHQARYHLASGWLQHGDRVIDAACGTGYGADIIQAHDDIDYTGVERDLSVLDPAITWTSMNGNRRFIEADLEIWQGPAEPFDVAVVLETLEHLDTYGALVEWTHRARKFVILSVPIVPTIHGNPFHRRDFTRESVEALYADMSLVAYFEQPDEISGVWVYRP